MEMANHRLMDLRLDRTLHMPHRSRERTPSKDQRLETPSIAEQGLRTGPVANVTYPESKPEL